MDLTRPCFVALTARGGILARRLADVFGGEWHATRRAADSGAGEPDQRIDDVIPHLRSLFLAGRPVIGVCAAAILIRAISAHTRSKHSDAPVLALSDDGKIIVPLLGGHHGANRLAEAIATETGGVAAITTAGDRAFGIALDEPPAGFVLADPDSAKAVMAGLLEGRKAMLSDDLPDHLAETAKEWRDWLSPIAASSDDRDDALRLHLSLRPAEGALADCVFHPRRVCLGLGASRHCPVDEMHDLVRRGLDQADIALAAIEGVYSVDLKADERAILAMADAAGHRLHLFTPDQLEAETPRLHEPSEVVMREVGCHGVAEASALAAAGPDGVVLLPKIRDAHATMALALKPDGAGPSQSSRHNGRVMLVGIGPGQHDWRTPEATAMIASADELVGYGFYIDLLGGLSHGKPRRDFALGEEEARCRYALEQAALGRDMAIICSGDAGIYAMGALVYELLARDEAEAGVSQAARRVEVMTAPGVSALQAAAARSGAILGHDFCTISLSDLLTPWDQIEQRIEAAGLGDFVIAFYNPVSRRRRVGMAKAKAILLNHRPADTPVVLATSLGRPEEEIRHRNLGDLDIDEIDMMTVVMVGASTSRRIAHAGGEAVFTPRGYAKHLDSPAQSAEHQSDTNEETPL